MTREETIIVLSILKSAYPRFYQGMNRADAESVINLWSVMFSQYSLDEVKIALYKIISTSSFPPSVSEVKQAIINSKSQNSDDISFVSSSKDAWASVVDAIRNFGYIRPVEAMQSFNSISKKTIKYMGGWKNLCISNNISADRDSFIKIYEQIEKSEYNKKLVDNNKLQIPKL